MFITHISFYTFVIPEDLANQKKTNIPDYKTLDCFFIVTAFKWYFESLYP